MNTKFNSILHSPTFIALLVCLGLCIVPLFRYWSVFSEKTDMKEISQLYANSQYIMGDASLRKISDGELYTYAGYAYTLGEDPTTINFEHPPLFKYLFGISYQVFSNSSIIALIFYFIYLFSAYLFSGTVITKKACRYASIIFLGFIPTVYVLASQILLDLPLNFLVLLLFALLFKKNISQTKKYILLGVVLGLLSSVKYPFPFLLLPISMVTLISLLNKEIKYLLYPAIITPLIYLAQYARYFSSHSLINFIQFEKYRFSWWMGERTIPKYLLIQNLFTGRFISWWGNKQSVTSPTWSPLLPLIFIAYIISFFFNPKHRTHLILYFYSLAVLAMYALGSATYLRYLTQLIPIWIALTVSAIESYKTNKNKHSSFTKQAKALFEKYY